MQMKIELVKKIRADFDLNIYETKVWLALLSKGISSAGEIAEMSGVPRSRTYDVLESLEKRGFAIEKLGKPIKYLAVKPAVVIEKLKNNTITRAEEKVKTLANLKDTKEYEELQELHKSGIIPIKHQDLSTSLKGKSNFYAQLRDTIENAEKSAYIVSSEYELTNKEKMFADLFSKLNKRKIDVKVIIHDSQEIAEKLTKKFKVPIKSKNINARFLIVDRAELLFIVNPNNKYEDFDHGIWINSSYLANSIAYMFELVWGSDYVPAKINSKLKELGRGRE